MLQYDQLKKNFDNKRLNELKMAISNVDYEIVNGLATYTLELLKTLHCVKFKLGELYEECD